MSLSELKPGQKGQVHSVQGNRALTKRLFALGCTPGTDVKVIKMAPLGDPMIINFRGFNLAIRKDDAKNIFLSES
ncbi:MAG: ferrous iron transport protein A [Clostridiaceae bacterium]